MMDGGHFIDFGIGVIQSALGVYLSWKAFIVGLKAPRKTEHKKQKVVFAFCCLAVIALAGVQTYRNFGLDRKLDKIEVNTERRASLALAIRSSHVENMNGVPTGRFPWLVLNDKASGYVAVTNAGQAMADNAWGEGRIYLVPSDHAKPDKDKVEEKRKDCEVLTAQFKKYLDHVPHRAVGTIPANNRDGIYFNPESERTITQEDMDKLANGGELLFLFISVAYTDAGGEHYLHRCQIAQTPAFNPEIWQLCDGFQDHQ